MTFDGHGRGQRGVLVRPAALHRAASGTGTGLPWTSLGGMSRSAAFAVPVIPVLTVVSTKGRLSWSMRAESVERVGVLEGFRQCFIWLFDATL